MALLVVVLTFVYFFHTPRRFAEVDGNVARFRDELRLGQRMVPFGGSPVLFIRPLDQLLERQRIPTGERPFVPHVPERCPEHRFVDDHRYRQCAYDIHLPRASVGDLIGQRVELQHGPDGELSRGRRGGIRKRGGRGGVVPRTGRSLWPLWSHRALRPPGPLLRIGVDLITLHPQEDDSLVLDKVQISRHELTRKTRPSRNVHGPLNKVPHPCTHQCSSLS